MSYHQCKCERPNLQGDLWCKTCEGLVEMGPLTSELTKEWAKKEEEKRLRETQADHINTNSNETKIGRNDLCPCMSGKKYKKCCM